MRFDKARTGRSGKARKRQYGHGMAWQERYGVSTMGAARRGFARQDWYGCDRCGAVSYGAVRQEWRDKDGRGSEGNGVVYFIKRGFK